MPIMTDSAFNSKIEAIINDYLYNISTLGNHDYFSVRNRNNSRARFFNNSGFDIISSESFNDNIVMEEAFLEGCTRVFLINPIFKLFLDSQKVQNDWQFGDTFANYTITNREYELGSFLEFIAVFGEKHVGVRYTNYSYSSTETTIMDRDFLFLYKNKAIPGFNKLKTIDELLVLDWSAQSEKEIDNLNTGIPSGKHLSTIISVEQFIKQYLSYNEYDSLIDRLRFAIKRAKDIIALKATPQLLPSNMMNFKKALLEEFSEEKVSSFQYEFDNGNSIGLSNTEDISVLNSNFFKVGTRNSIIGNSDFAKSFITSEYLFKSINAGLSIDYTSVVVGYLKSIEQLLFLLYVSAFDGKAGMLYWDRCNKDKDFDVSLSEKYRIDPYNEDKGWKQENYYHRKKLGDRAPDIGELILFLRYFQKMWAISESGKEFVFSCLDDFRSHDRNSHFHKDNISLDQYETVVRIRNNTHVCLYYLLGGFFFLDSSASVKNQLGIIDYRLEFLYREISQRRRLSFVAKFADEDECILYYLKNDKNIEFSPDGTLSCAELRFMKISSDSKDISLSDVRQLLENENYVRKNTVGITRENFPLEIKPIRLMKSNK